MAVFGRTSCSRNRLEGEFMSYALVEKALVRIVGPGGRWTYIVPAYTLTFKSITNVSVRFSY